MSSFSLLFAILVLSIFSLSTADEYFLQFGHQAPQQSLVKVDLLVNSILLPPFTGLSYPEVSGFLNISSLASEGSDSFNLTLVISGTSTLLSTDLYDFEDEYYSYFAVDSLTESLTVLFESADITVPKEKYAHVRTANFAPVDGDFYLYINGVKQTTDFDYSDLSEYSEYFTGIYTFSVQRASGVYVAWANFTLAAGEVRTVIFNGVENAFSLAIVSDEDFSDTYTNCYVRVINSVADPDYSSLTPVFVPGKISLDYNISFAEVTDYADLPAASAYRVYFPQDDEVDDYLNAPSADFACIVGDFLTISYQGLPGPKTPLAGLVSLDQAGVPFYQEAQLRVFSLSTSYTGELRLSLDGEHVANITYPDPSGYFAVTGENTFLVDVALTKTEDETVFYSGKVPLTAGQTFTYSVVGLSDDEDYPLSGVVSQDSGSSTTTTTTTTGTTTGTTTTTTGTTGSSTTTGHHDDDDDDDDDDLNGGEIAGIVIGVLVGVALLGALVYCFVQRKRRSQFSTIG